MDPRTDPLPGSSPTATARVTAAVQARDSYGRLLAYLASTTGDIAAAEDALADAFERALARWPEEGVPSSPQGWLLTVARNRLRDHWKSAATRTGVPLEAGRHAGATAEGLPDEVDPDAVGDRRLELMLVCAHPAIDPAVRTPLMLSTVLGFTAAQVAVAFALPPATLAARLVRAKRRIKEARIPFVVPDRSALPERMGHLLEAVYGCYVIDWPIGGPEPTAMAAEARHLAEILADLAPGHETHGLAALINLAAARGPARLDDQGRFVPLSEQDTTRWDQDLIARGHRHLRAAQAAGGVGRFSLEAAAQALHCDRARTGATDWTALLGVHRALHRLAPTLGSAVALATVTAETDGPAAALSMLDELAERPDVGAQVARFQPAWAARGHLMDQLGRPAEAASAYEKAISLTTAPAERAHLESLLERSTPAPDES